MSAATIATLERLKRSLAVARDLPHPQANPNHLRGLRAGLQIAIDGIDAEIRLLNMMYPTNNNQGAEQA